MTTLLILALCNGALAMTLTKSRFFRFLRVWVTDRSDFWGELVQCPFCFGHWLSFIATAVFRPRFTFVWWPADYFVSAFSLVALTAFVAGGIYRLFTPPTIRAQDLQSILTQK